MFYKIMSQQYLKEAEVLRLYVKNLRILCTDSKSSRNEMDFRVSTLYAMYLELKHTGEYLNKKSEVIYREK